MCNKNHTFFTKSFFPLAGGAIFQKNLINAPLYFRVPTGENGKNKIRRIVFVYVLLIL